MISDSTAQPLPERAPDPIFEPAVTAVVSPAKAAEKAKRALQDIYFVSGLGADERVFRLLKFEGFQPVHIHWIEPERNESIEHYAKRLTTQIKSEEPVIVGLSFGGMIAIEIAKQIDVKATILISSAKTQAEIPPYYKLFRWFPIYRILPFKWLMQLVFGIVSWFFSLESRDECKLLWAILMDTNMRFFHWAIHKVVTWKNETYPAHLHHLHGKGDRIFPLRYVTPDYTIDAGGHFMVMNRAAHVSSLIEQIIDASP